MKTVRRLMTEMEKEAVSCLSQVRFLPASWDKRFARSLSGSDTLTEKEAPQVWRLFKRYRRQIAHPRKAELLAMADELSAPDLRKQQRQIDEMRRYQEAMQNK